MKICEHLLKYSKLVGLIFFWAWCINIIIPDALAHR